MSDVSVVNGSYTSHYTLSPEGMVTGTTTCNGVEIERQEFTGAHHGIDDMGSLFLYATAAQRRLRLRAAAEHVTRKAY